MLVGSIIFADKTFTLVEARYLLLFTDLDGCSGYSWGAAALVTLYRYLGDASMYSCKQLGGYPTLLQCWIHEYFPTVGKRGENWKPADNCGLPRAMRWSYRQGVLKVDDLRPTLDELTPADVIWRPFEDHRAWRLQENEVSNASAQQKKEVSNASARVKSSGAKKTVARKKPTTKYRSCLRTFLEMTDIPTGGVRTVHMEVGIFGFDYDQMIGNEDFMQVFSHEEIGVTVVNTYIRFLYDKLMRPNGLDVSFGFLAPATVNLGLILSRPDTVTEYVLRILMDNKDAEKLFFIPFNTGGHWLLLAINPIREIVYYLDSLGNDWTTYPDMKVLIDTVLQAFRAQRDIQTSRRGANSITWIKVACPQQRNQIDCGYFMLRFMRDTLALGRLKIPTDYFEEFKCAFYTKDQVDEIKEEWCQFMIELNVCS
ncbi:hypothetical protein KIW84_056530 [Lathyrus oleraceus]|uniref:Ubiquitin-like protease family profile domain-containing protein n=1 Tax=Pisum sativum TaxID=3888 RepID=A0A9D4X167_PEA|nr:hypothetical protein KIW84_056530 [Pisum sativum]